MPGLESALVALEARLAEAQKPVDALTRALGRLRRAARQGHIADVEKILAVIGASAAEAEAAAGTLPAAWDFDAKAYLEGGFLAELREATAAAGVNLVDKDGRIYAFPLLLRIERGETAVRIGKKLERRIRPNALARQLAAIQKRPQRFSEQRFLDLLYRVYQRIGGVDWRKIEAGLGPVVPLADIHSILTLLPQSDYPIEEFGRDLLLLDRRPDLRTRDGHRFSFPGSAIARERVQRITVFDEDGRERVYIGLTFVKEP
jgi:hypothetical protein